MISAAEFLKWCAIFNITPGGGGGGLSPALNSGNIFVGNASNIATGVTMSGDGTMSNTGALTLANTAVTAGTYTINGVNFLTVDSKGRLTFANDITVTTPPGGSAGGDLSGFYPNPVVSGLNGVPLGTATATAGNVLVGSGTSWITQTISNDATMNASGQLTLANTAVTPGTYTINGVNFLTVDSKGRLTSASNITVGITGQALTRVNDTNVTLTLGGSSATALVNPSSLTLGWTGQLAVARGGTGDASFTAFSVLCGGTTSTSALQSVSGLGTAGQVLTSNGAGALPTWQSGGGGGGITSLIADDTGTATGSSVTVSGGTTGLTTTASGSTLDLTGTLNVAHGGTGATSLLGLLTGNNTSAITATTISQFAVLTGGAGNVPHSVPLTITSGLPLISQGTATQPIYGTAVVAGGGTGKTSFSAFSVICAGTTNTGALQNVSSTGSAGQVLTSNGAGALPTWQNSGGGVTAAQVQDQAFTFSFDGGSTNAYTVTLSPAPASLVDGLTVTITPNVTNTGASTLDVNSLGATSIVLPNLALLTGGEMQGASTQTLVYNSTVGSFVLQTGGNYLTPSNVQQQTYTFASDTGTANNITLAFNPPFSTNSTALISFLAGSSNTGATTVKVDALTAIPLVLSDGSALIGGEIVSSRSYLILYTPGANKYVLLNPSTSSISVNASQIQNQTFTFWVDSGSAGNVVITPSPAITSYQQGQLFWIKLTQSISSPSGSNTINVNGLGAIPMGFDSPVGGMFSLHIYGFVYDADTSTFLCVNPPNPCVTFGQLQFQTYVYGVDTGTANTYVINKVASYSDGVKVSFKAGNANTGASTLDAGAGVKNLVKNGNISLLINNILANGTYEATYNSTYGAFVLLNPS